MTKKELNTFRTLLENARRELGSGNPDREALAVDTSPDEFDRIQQAADREHVIRNMERNATRLHEIRTALQRLDSGTFGVCTTCEEDIHSKRLAAVPWAALCISCQEVAEQEAEMAAREAGAPLRRAA